MEIGSEYNLSLSELTVTDDSIFTYLNAYEHCHYFDSGRSAIKHVSNQLGNKMKVLLPEFICESVSNCFDKKQIMYYRLKKDFTIDIDDLNDKVGEKPRAIFVMHYFGALQPISVLDSIRLIADQSQSIIIEDTTHSIFTKAHTIGDYMVCSIRKWMPLSGGGILYYNDNSHEIDRPNYPVYNNNLRSYGMVLKDLFLKTKVDFKSEYRKIFAESEEELDRKDEIFEISDLSRFIASCVNVNGLKTIRQHNYRVLESELLDMGVVPAIRLSQSEIPFVLPIRVPCRDTLRTYLINKQIYCAVHWPFDEFLSEQRLFAKQIASQLISFPIDQRYNEEHIAYLVEMLRQYGGDLSC